MESSYLTGDALQPVAVLHPGYSRSEPVRSGLGQMVGCSPAMQRLFSQMRHTARHLRIATIEGESGTGKLLAARSLHDLALGPERPFIVCPAAEIAGNIATLNGSQTPVALTRSSLESALSALPLIKESSGGTLVLTRIDQLSSAQQERLLELLQWTDRQHLLRAPDSIPQHILCLSSQPSRALAPANRLRCDLAKRLTAIRFAVPPLRDRRVDIPLLAEIFAQRVSAQYGKQVHGLDPQTLPRLLQHSWPGNVSELESVIRAAALECPGQWIRPIDLPAFPAAPAPPNDPPGSGASPASSSNSNNEPNPDPNLDRTILRHVHSVLARAEGNKFRAAKMLGISRSTLYRLLDSASDSVPTAG